MGLKVRFFRGLGVAGLVLAGVLSGLPAAPIAGVGAAYAQSASDIVVEGNRRVEADTIRSYFKPGPGERLDAAKIDSALKALYATGLFQDVKIRHEGSRLVVSVVENQVINRVAFEGNHSAKDEQLTAEIQSKPRGTFSRAMVQADVQRIVDIYQRSGRYNVRVDPKIIELPNNRVDLVFEINEGDKTTVQKIVFVGNHAFSDYRLKDVIKTSQSDWLSWLRNNDSFDPDRIEADRDLLRKFYLKSGYADVRIVSAQGVYDPAVKGFVVTYTIDEGPRYKFGAVEVHSSISTVDARVLQARLRMSPGNIYNAEAVDKSVEDMTVEISKRGYPFAVVRARGDRDVQNRKIDVVFTVDDGPHVYVERINIRGNTRTRDYVIRREFDIAEGDAFNRALLDRAERRIKNLDYFKSVKMTTEQGSAPDRIIINCDVEEKSTGEFSFSAGYSTVDGVIGEVGVGERNFLGGGETVKASVQYGQYTRGVNLSYVEPYLFGNRLAMGLDFFGRKTTDTQYFSYSSETLGGAIRFGIPLTDYITGNVRYSGYTQKISLASNLDNCNANPANPNLPLNPPPGCYSDGEASLAIRQELAQGQVFVSLIGYGLTYNTLDNNRFPTSGIYASINQDVAGIGGDVNFIKTTGDFKHYLELIPDWVGMTRVQVGYAAGWGGQDLRMLDHFQGSPSLIRGFQPAGFGPRDLTPGTNQDALGGSEYWAATYEIQTPLFLAPKDFGMRLALFADAGQLLDYRGPRSWAATGETICQGTAGNVNLADACDDSIIRSSAGVGLLWDSPIGPLRFDFAYALTKASYDRTQIFRFGGGAKF